MDTISRERRSANMAAIRSFGTAPEKAVRTAIFHAGLRYRLHDKRLPGKPDIVFPARMLAVFVHGCFWHGCTKCIDGRRAVKSNSEYWKKKISGNRERDERNRRKLREMGWSIEEIWECDTSDNETVAALIDRIRAVRPLSRKARAAKAKGQPTSR